MRLIDADELMEHAWRDKLDSRELIAEMIENAPTVAPARHGLILDKIRAEFINKYPKNYMGEPELGGVMCAFSLNDVLDVIDKYKAAYSIKH